MTSESGQNISVPQHKTSFFFLNHLKYNAIRLYNLLPGAVKAETETKKFGKLERHVAFSLLLQAIVQLVIRILALLLKYAILTWRA